MRGRSTLAERRLGYEGYKVGLSGLSWLSWLSGLSELLPIDKFIRQYSI